MNIKRGAGALRGKLDPRTRVMDALAIGPGKILIFLAHHEVLEKEAPLRIGGGLGHRDELTVEPDPQHDLGPTDGLSAVGGVHDDSADTALLAARLAGNDRTD